LNLLQQEEIAKHNLSFEIFALFTFHPAYRLLLDLASVGFMENKFASFFTDLQSVRVKLVVGELENAQTFAEDPNHNGSSSNASAAIVSSLNFRIEQFVNNPSSSSETPSSKPLIHRNTHNPLQDPLPSFKNLQVVSTREQLLFSDKKKSPIVGGATGTSGI
jgi:hypothetical protein